MVDVLSCHVLHHGLYSLMTCSAMTHGLSLHMFCDTSSIMTHVLSWHLFSTCSVMTRVCPSRRPSEKSCLLPQGKWWGGGEGGQSSMSLSTITNQSRPLCYPLLWFQTDSAETPWLVSGLQFFLSLVYSQGPHWLLHPRQYLEPP